MTWSSITHVVTSALAYSPSTVLSASCFAFLRRDTAVSSIGSRSGIASTHRRLASFVAPSIPGGASASASRFLRPRQPIDAPMLDHRPRRPTSRSSSSSPTPDRRDGGATELSIPCSDGVTLAALYWKPNPVSPATTAAADPTAPRTSEPRARRVVCLHGWLDNAASFHLLAPSLRSRPGGGAHVLALDLPGHGRSGHKSRDGPTGVMAEYAVYLAEALAFMEWTGRGDDPVGTGGIALVGHSMGAAVCILYAAAFPARVSSLVLLEGTGPLARETSAAPALLRDAVRRRVDHCHKKDEKEGGRVYESLEKAVEVRRRAAGLLPGKQYLSAEAARAIVRRGTTAVEDGGVRFAHDPRLHFPSLHYYTRGQAAAFRRGVECRVCLLTAEDGWPAPEGAEAVEEEFGEMEVRKVLGGSHHFHADPETSGAVVDEVVAFLE